MTYQELRAEQQARISEFLSEYGFFAFSQDQYKVGIEKLQTEELVRIPGGGFIRKDKYDEFLTMMHRHFDELQEALKEPETAYQAFVTELNNHEYSYTRDVTETLEALGLTQEMVNESAVLSAALERAVKYASITS